MHDNAQAGGANRHRLAGPRSGASTRAFRAPERNLGGDDFGHLRGAAEARAAAHRCAMQRIVQAVAVPVTGQQVLLEFQGDWARRETYGAVKRIVLEHLGACEQAYTRVHKQPPLNVRYGAVQ